jgi:hypothetical protein
MPNIAIIWTVGGVLFAACCARGVAMRASYVDEMKWYTIGFAFLAGTCLLWAWSEAGAVHPQRVVLGVVGAIFGSLFLIFIGELIRPVPLAAQNSNDTRPNSNSATSTGQSGGVTAGTIIINPAARQANYGQIIDQLASYMRQGGQITQDWINNDDTDKYIAGSNKWGDDVANFLYSALGVSYSEQFKASTGTAMMGMPFGHSLVGGGRYQQMAGKINYLSRIIDELRKQ